MDADDRALFEAWCRGDRRAGASLFDRHYEAVSRFLRNKTGEGEAPDLIQRTFLACVESRDRFRGDASFRTYLFAVARHVLHNHYRARASAAASLDFAETTAEALAPSSSEILRGAQDRRLLLAALRRIPIECQEALELHYWEQMGTAEIAEVVGVPAGTVKSRLQRGRRLLEERLAELADSAEALRTTLATLDRWAEGVRREAPRPG
jgi:RNA polymerase sigma-70 factor (ECF subfamily)